MSQYFENDPKVKSNPRLFHYLFHGESFSFHTDAGVFSKNTIDEGSIALLEVVRAKPLNGPILDVGCGYGVLGIILERISQQSVTMFDVNKRAVELTKKNIVLNECKNAKAHVASDYSNLKEGSFDTIVINPPIRAGKKVIYPLLEGAYDYLAFSGSLYFVMRRTHGAKSAAKVVQAKFNNCTLVKKDKGYYIYEANKNDQKIK